MATIWNESQGEFTAVPLQGAREPAGAAPPGPATARKPFLIVPYRTGAQLHYVWLPGNDDDARVNGAPVVGGIRVLQHKDELRAGASRAFLSTEATPVVEPYFHDGTRRRPRCPICRAEVQDDQLIVRCPRCSRIYHQLPAAGTAAAKPCWTYGGPTCRFCSHPTSLNGESAWRPPVDSPL